MSPAPRYHLLNLAVACDASLVPRALHWRQRGDREWLFRLGRKAQPHLPHSLANRLLCIGWPLQKLTGLRKYPLVPGERSR